MITFGDNDSLDLTKRGALNYVLTLNYTVTDIWFFVPSLSLPIALAGYAVVSSYCCRLLLSGTSSFEIGPTLDDSHSIDVQVNKSSMDLCAQQTHRKHPTREGNLSIHYV